MLNRITVQLPVEGLLFWNMSGREALSESFALTVTLLGTDARIDRSKLLGQPITVTIPTQNLMSNRYINGKVTRVAVSAVELTGTRYAVYTLTVESDLWPMKRDKNLRIFQGQTVPQIVKTLLGEYQVNIEDKLTGSYRVWDYCVQYQESSFDFISRLMELEGITYHFQHQSDSHTMVLTDAATQHQPFAGYEVIPYHQTPSGGSTDEEGIGQWALEDNVTPGIYSLDDYDFRKPNAWMFQARQNPSSPVPGSIDVYDWPGRFVEHGHGEFYARIHQERWQVEHQLIHGTATAIGVAPGNTFALTNAPFFSDNGEYLTTEATYYFEENRYSSGNDGETVHRVDFTVIPSNIPFRPLQTTQWPRTYGPQTAKVVGPKGESIWTDKYGRVKVKFHWDRMAKGDDTSSCWVRVSSAWAGQGFGGVQIPRVGDEVVIDFINGDPDRPIITGRVYNEASMPPWALPAAATQMGFLSRSKDGSTDSANALRFEDRAGEEHVWIQAQRNMDVNVKNDASQSIGSNNSHYVRKNEVYRVEENQAQAVKGGTEILTGQGKLDAVVGKFVIASGEQLRLVSGESAIELNANGQINLVGKGFNFFVENEGFITTGGKLHLNTAGTEPGTSAPGSTHQKDIKAAVQEKFTPGKPSKAGAPAQKAPAAAAPKPVAEFKNAPASSGDKISNYDYSLQDMVDKQKNLKAKPQKWSRTGFVNASEDDIKKYTNPDNFNSGDAKYQFLDLSASSGISEDDMGSFLKGKGVLEGQQKAYLDAAQKYNVSEVYLASHSALETGNGASALAKGVEVHGVKVYNMYGIGALDGNAEKTGANYAYKMGWTSPEKAIDGGAKWISEKYINNADYAQNNLYKMRWNPASPGTHQYATDVNWASAQTANMKKLFDNFPRAKLSYDIPKFK